MGGLSSITDSVFSRRLYFEESPQEAIRDFLQNDTRYVAVGAGTSAVLRSVERVSLLKPR